MLALVKGAEAEAPIDRDVEQIRPTTHAKPITHRKRSFETLARRLAVRPELNSGWRTDGERMDVNH